MNSAPSKTKSAATETSDEIRNSAECTALRAMTVSRPATIAAIAKIQKKTVSQPERIIADCRLPIADLKLALSLFEPAYVMPISEIGQISLSIPQLQRAKAQLACFCLSNSPSIISSI